MNVSELHLQLSLVGGVCVEQLQVHREGGEAQQLPSGPEGSGFECGGRNFAVLVNKSQSNTRVCYLRQQLASHCTGEMGVVLPLDIQGHQVGCISQTSFPKDGFIV